MYLKKRFWKKENREEIGKHERVWNPSRYELPDIHFSCHRGAITFTRFGGYYWFSRHDQKEIPDTKCSSSKGKPKECEENQQTHAIMHLLDLNVIHLHGPC